MGSPPKYHLLVSTFFLGPRSTAKPCWNIMPLFLSPGMTGPCHQKISHLNREHNIISGNTLLEAVRVHAFCGMRCSWSQFDQLTSNSDCPYHLEPILNEGCLFSDKLTAYTSHSHMSQISSGDTSWQLGTLDLLNSIPNALISQVLDSVVRDTFSTHILLMFGRHTYQKLKKQVDLWYHTMINSPGYCSASVFVAIFKAKFDSENNRGISMIWGISSVGRARA